MPCLQEGAARQGEHAELAAGVRPEALDERQIEDLIGDHLPHLEVLQEDDMADALHDFVDKVRSTCTSRCSAEVVQVRHL